MDNVTLGEEQPLEAQAEEPVPCILEEVWIEEMAVDGICGIY
ncbi:MAG: variant-type mycofactocin precursor [Desulfobaccales bacterium]